MLLVREEAANVGKGSRVCHVDGDGVSVTEGDLWHQLVEWRPAKFVSVNYFQ